MKSFAQRLRQPIERGWQAWDRFWFTPADPATLGLVRILAGAMLLYTHLVWTIDLEAFFGPQGWISTAALETFSERPPTGASIRDSGPSARSIANNDEVELVQPATSEPNASWRWWPGTQICAPSHFTYCTSSQSIWTMHLIALSFFVALTIGYQTRIASLGAWLFTLSYIHRNPASTFGLDQINAMLALYLMLGPSGAAFSMDAWLARRRAQDPAQPLIGANVAVRLIQCHMCVIYLFSGLAKVVGSSWWDGEALWLALSNQEYQTLDLSFLASWPMAINFLTQATVLWEVFFIVLIWSPRWRPLILAMSLFVHLGIGVALGMMTFGLVMVIGCASFLEPADVRAGLAFVRNQFTNWGNARPSNSMRQNLRSKPSTARS